ncbi:MAG: hypothetical protein ACYC54_00405 [Sedimentisphaerales bacterium]
MKDTFLILVAIPIFIILLVVIFRTIKGSLKFDGPASIVLSICVSILATIALNSNLSGTIGMIMTPYKALGICILAIVFMALLFKGREKGKDRQAKPKDCLRYNVDELQTKESDDDRIKR